MSNPKLLLETERYTFSTSKNDHIDDSGKRTWILS